MEEPSVNEIDVTIKGKHVTVVRFIFNFFFIQKSILENVWKQTFFIQRLQHILRRFRDQDFQ